MILLGLVSVGGGEIGDSFSQGYSFANIAGNGRGRALDNVFVERLWRTVKYEHLYLHDYATVIELVKGLDQYFTFYSYERPHQSLSYQTPAEVYLQRIPA